MGSRYALIGHPLGHSFSAEYFSRKFLREGREDCMYENLDLSSADALTDVKRSEKYAGFNVTIPYKRAVLPFLDGLSPEAAAIGAVNVIEVRDGRWIGHNSDCIGFSESLLAFLDGFRPARALILGNGGASQAVQYVLRQMGMAYRVVTRRPETVCATGAAFSGHTPGGGTSDGRATSLQALRYEELTAAAVSECELIINTTSLGMWPDTGSCAPIAYEAVGAGHYCFDIVYNPEVTEFMKRCAAQGAKVCNGLDMLHRQAEASWNIWSARV